MKTEGNTSDGRWKGFVQLLHSLKDFLIASSRVLKTENQEKSLQFNY